MVVQVGDSQVTLLIIKHVFFTGIFILGLIAYAKARKTLKGING